MGTHRTNTPLYAYRAEIYKRDAFQASGYFLASWISTRIVAWSGCIVTHGGKAAFCSQIYGEVSPSRSDRGTLCILRRTLLSGASGSREAAGLAKGPKFSLP